MTIKASIAAAEHIAAQLKERGRGVGVRVGVKTTGCSGLAYVLEFVDTPEASDKEFVSNGVKLFVDPKSLVYLDGVELDFMRKGLNSGFDFVNPNATAECGCGESFHV